MEDMEFTLFKVSYRKERKKHPWITFDQSKKQQTLNKFVRSDVSQHILLHKNQFVCIVPLYDFEYHWLIKKPKRGFNISDLINAIIKTTISMYKMDMYLNPTYYKCNKNPKCAEDVAQGYVLSHLYKTTSKNTIFVWFDADH